MAAPELPVDLWVQSVLEVLVTRRFLAGLVDRQDPEYPVVPVFPAGQLDPVALEARLV
jgi:hypothetical protein